MKLNPVYLLFFSCLSLQAKAEVETEPGPGTVPGKIYFSNQPMLTSNAGSKTSFSSAEYIYGRLELSGTTIKDAFRIKAPGKAYPYIQCRVTITNANGYEMGGSGRNYILINEDERDNSSLSFDVMPEPSHATTVFSITDDFNGGLGFDPLYNTIVNEKLKEGKYTVKVTLYLETQDAYGSWEDQEKWPTITEEFELNFRDADIARVINNSKQVAETINENAFRHTKMPDIFSHGATITDPMATNAKVLAIVKRDLPKRTILKMVIEKTGTLWSTANDDFGLPKYRYFYPGVYVAYKIDGKCYIGKITLRQDYTGGGTFGPLHVGFTSGSEDKGIDCEKVK